MDLFPSQKPVVRKKPMFLLFSLALSVLRPLLRSVCWCEQATKRRWRNSQQICRYDITLSLNFVSLTMSLLGLKTLSGQRAKGIRDRYMLICVDTCETWCFGGDWGGGGGESKGNSDQAFKLSLPRVFSTGWGAQQEGDYESFFYPLCISLNLVMVLWFETTFETFLLFKVLFLYDAVSV